MKINYEFLKKLFNKKIRLKKKSDKIKLSNYSEYIPMYDIYSKNIYLIKNVDLHYRLEESHYRFINNEIINWIKNTIKKEKDKQILDKYNNIIDIMSNYDLDILEENSYRSVYKYSPKFGLSISICRRKSFHPYITNLKPYYTKFELIKLGQNMGIIKKMDSIKLIDKELHYKICKKVSNNDISRDEILEFNKNIIKNKSIGWLCNYSFTGSYILNNFLRNKDKNSISKTNYEGLNKIIKTIETSPSFKNDYFFYRFIINDDFLMNLKIGDIFEDNGIISSTRDPFYNPNIIQEDFGFILIKINIPRNVKGLGCLIENFSLFSKEEELIIKPLIIKN